MKTTKLILAVAIITFSSNISAQFCSDYNKELLKEFWVAANEPSLINWDFEATNYPIDDSWEGITMTADGCLIKSISLWNKGLTGTLTPFIGLMDSLQYLNIGLNDFTGTISSQIAAAKELRTLLLANNNFSGNIPSELVELSNLEHLDLKGNNLSGTIYPFLATLDNLLSLDLGGNLLTGTIPPQFGQFESLETLSLQYNDLTGTIPTELGNISTLVALFVGGNNTNGTIPEELGNLANLVIFHCESGNFEGSLPSNLLFTDQFAGLWLDDNNFSGCIPIELNHYCDNQSQIKIQNNPLLDNDDFSTFCASGEGKCPEPEDDFVTTWKTSNPGVSDDKTIYIPAVNITPVPIYYDVDWEDDGIFDDFGVNSGISHTYATSGQYTVRIRGSFPRIYFNNNIDKDKIVSVDQWGTGKWQSMINAFKGCSNLSVLATDTPDLSETTSLAQMFSNCGNIEADLSDWDVSTIYNMLGMFSNSELSTENYDALLISWSQNSLQSNVPFDAGSSLYCDGRYARQDISAIFLWDISDGGEGVGCNPDIDGDGNLNDEDCDPFDPLVYVGSPCNDGFFFTDVDVLNEDCICQGYVSGPSCSMAVEVTEGITHCLGISQLGGPSATNACFQPIALDAVWYKYAATGCDVVTVSSSIGPVIKDTRLSIFDDCNALDCVAFDDDSGEGYSSTASFLAQPGETYYIEWDSRWSSSEFDFEISTSDSNSCPTDFNFDGVTNGTDFSIFLGNFEFTCSDSCGCATDLNNDGVTNGEDFTIFLGNMGLTCP